MTDDINVIASKHLGRNADGTVNAVYVTPDQIDSSLLVPVPRSLNRDTHDIDGRIFEGWDVWHCYEFSSLMDNGQPIVGIIKLAYSSSSLNIVESKSLKLYLNSFNMVRMGDNLETSVKAIEDRIKSDLSDVIRSNVNVSFFDLDSLVQPSSLISGSYKLLDKMPECRKGEYMVYEESNSILQVVDNDTKAGPLKYRSPSLRSNCRITNQPDWGDVFIVIDGEKTVTPLSLLQYIVSMRTENHFHEEICELIYKRLFDLLQPKQLMVTCLYTRRGGIDINPVRTNNPALVDTNLIDPHHLSQQTGRQ